MLTKQTRLLTWYYIFLVSHWHWPQFNLPIVNVKMLLIKKKIENTVELFVLFANLIIHCSLCVHNSREIYKFISNSFWRIINKLIFEWTLTNVFTCNCQYFSHFDLNFSWELFNYLCGQLHCLKYYLKLELGNQRF